MDNLTLVLSLTAFIVSAIALFFALYSFIRVMNETSKKTQIIYDHLSAEERSEEIQKEFGELIKQDFEGMEL